jgi:competence protein ComFC
MAPQYMFTRFIVKSLHACFDSIWPSECVVCAREGDWLCGVCLAEVEPATADVCPLCAQPSRAWQTCKACREARGLSGVRSLWLYHGAVRKLVHSYKYNGLLSMTDWVVAQLAPAISGLPLECAKPVVICPVPSTRAKVAKRGFNQSAMLASALAAELHFPYYVFLARQNHTTSQTKLTREERFANLSGQIVPRQRVPPDTTIILIDDVLTTGATLSECAKILLEAGAAAVWAVTIAKD